MNRNILDQIGGDISSFRKKSFRLDQLNSSRNNFGDAFSKFRAPSQPSQPSQPSLPISNPKTRSHADNIDTDSD